MSCLLPLLDKHYDHILVHSGQHYSANMDQIFFKELKLKKPDAYLEVKAKSPGAQLAQIISRFEKILLAKLPEAIIVHGDTNTTLAGALATVKHKDKKIKLIHVEAGARSFNEDQAEEINRKIVDQISDLLLIANKNELVYVKREGIKAEKAIVTGNTVIESCMRMARLVKDRMILNKYGIKRGKYIVATFHRQETVDDKNKLKSICRAINLIATDYDLILPLHPRTKKMIKQYGIKLAARKLKIIKPIGYKDMIGLIKNCRFGMTDSGGLQEEAAVLKIPVLILRGETEHIKYVKNGMHKIVSTNYNSIVREAKKLIEDNHEYKKRKSAKTAYRKNIAANIIKGIKRFLA